MPTLHSSPACFFALLKLRPTSLPPLRFRISPLLTSQSPPFSLQCLSAAPLCSLSPLPPAPHLSAPPNDAHIFFADANVSWASLGVSRELVDALRRAQLHHPSAVQASAIPPILTSSDVVMAAETGSGKTQAYLVPLCQKLRKRNEVKNEIAKESLGQTQTSAFHNFALVLCPNAMLCEQVAQMANALCDSFGVPFLKVSVVSGGQGWPVSPPDLVIATPAALLNNLFAYDPRRRRRNAFLRDVKCVVFDEADMLLSGGFENQVMRLLNMFRLEEKQLSKTMQGEATTDSADPRPWTEFEPAESTLEDDLEVEDEEASDDQDEDHESDLGSLEAETSSKSEQKSKKDWLRSRKVYVRSKQYVFAAATLPENGKKTPGAVLKRLFPDARWVNGLFLHRHNPRLQRNWVEVDENTKVAALINAISNSSAVIENSPKKSLVFANSVEAVDAICRVLKRAEIDCLCYHRDIPSEERLCTLKVFQEKGGVLVCTDSAARGLDIPNIGHVIQNWAYCPSWPDGNYNKLVY